MVQDILTYISIISATSWVVYSIYKTIHAARQKHTTCGGCSAQCALKKHVLAK